MRRIILLLLFLNLSFQLYGQKRQNCYLTVRKDTVYIFLKENPEIGQGFYIERKGADDEEYIRLFEEPIKPVLNPIIFADILGGNYHFIQNSLGVSSPQELLLRLRTDRFASTVYIMLFHRVGTALGRFYKAGAHTPGETYRYRIVITDEGEIVQTIDKEIQITERLPHPPQEVLYQQQQRSVKIKWDYPRWQPGAEDMTVQFYMYKKTSGTDFERLDDKVLLRLDNTDYQYIDTRVDIGKEYIYKMTAVDASGLESKATEEVTIKVKDIIAPAPPAGLVTLPSEDKVELVWNFSPELDIHAYNVYRWKGVEQDSIMLNTNNIPYDQPHFIDLTCVTGQQYYYAVSALDTAGNESRHSNRISAFPTDRTPPGIPQNFEATVKDNNVILTWTAPEDEDLLGYRIFRGLSEDRHNQVYLTPDPIKETNFIDHGEADHKIIPGQRYCYAVAALDTLWHQSKRVYVWVAVPDNEPPAAPGAIIIENDHGTALTLKWNSSPSLDVSGYVVYRGSDSALDSVGYFSKINRKFRDTNLSKGKEYFYHIVALDTAGNRSEPAVSNAVFFRDFSPPPRVQYVAVQKTEGGMQISWERVVDFDLKEYRVYRSSSPTGTFIRIGSVALDTPEFLDKEGREDFWYSIRAVDSSGNESKNSKPQKADR
ncbi:MAG: hypothetical protein R6V04_05440 [bacterium]